MNHLRFNNHPSILEMTHLLPRALVNKNHESENKHDITVNGTIRILSNLFKFWYDWFDCLWLHWIFISFLLSTWMHRLTLNGDDPTMLLFIEATSKNVRHRMWMFNLQLLKATSKKYFHKWKTHRNMHL